MLHNVIIYLFFTSTKLQPKIQGKVLVLTFSNRVRKGDKIPWIFLQNTLLNYFVAMGLFISEPVNIRVVVDKISLFPSSFTLQWRYESVVLLFIG